MTQRRWNQGPEGETLAVCCTLCLCHEETTAFQALYPTSPAILSSFKQTRTDMQLLLAKVPNPNIGSRSYSIQELITATSLWLPTAFCLQVCICNDPKLHSRCPQAPWNHCYLSNNKASFSPLTGCYISHTSSFIHPQNIPSQIKSRQFWSMVLIHSPCFGKKTRLTLSCSTLKWAAVMGQPNSLPKSVTRYFCTAQRVPQDCSQRTV